MTQLEDDLAELARTLPGLADEFAAVVTHAGPLQARLDEAKRALEQDTGQVEQVVQLLQLLADAPDALTRKAHVLDVRLQAALDSLEKAAQAAEGELAQAGTALQAASDGLETGAARLQQALQEMQSSLDGAAQGGHAAVDALETLAHGGEERVGTAAAAVAEEVAALKVLLENMSEPLKDGSQALLTRATALGDDAAHHTEDLLKDAEQRGGDIKEHYEEVAGSTFDGVTTVLEDGLFPRLEQALGAGVHHPAALVQDELQELVVRAGQAHTAVAEGRDAWHQAVTALEHTADPLPHVIQEIHEAAERMRHQ